MIRHWLTLRRGTLAAALVSLVGLTALADTAPRLPDEIVAGGWEEITFDGKRPNRYAACGPECVEITTEASVSMIGRPADADLTDRPILTWQWKIERPVEESDLATKGKDDRAVGVYVTFPYDPETASLSEKLLRPMVEMARGADAPSRVIAYVWGGFGNRGDTIESPFFGSVNAMVICRTKVDPVGKWLDERFDVAADHERIFGFRPKTAAHVLLTADSDDTGADNRAFVRRIAFSGK